MNFLKIKMSVTENITIVKGLREIFFFKNYADSEAGKLVPYLFLFFKKA